MAKIWRVLAPLSRVLNRIFYRHAISIENDGHLHNKKTEPMKKTPGSIRIIAGTHRSRKIDIIDAPDLRPTTDRIRETVFNWLYGYLGGASVLDLYAGSGILSFEAASRGAEQVYTVEKNPHVFRQLLHNQQQLGFEQIQCLNTSAEQFLQGTAQSFDLIFLDPPFNAHAIDEISAIIGPFVKANGLLYREYNLKQTVAALDSNQWHLKKSKKAGQVKFELWQKNE